MKEELFENVEFLSASSFKELKNSKSLLLTFLIFFLQLLNKNSFDPFIIYFTFILLLIKNIYELV
jgi:hypothetical protein